MKKYNGILLIGPTGSGKTPFGDFLNNRKLFNKNCYHFDFGENLRKIWQLYNKPNLLKSVFSLLKDREIEIIINSLKHGTLLEDDQFYIAENILLSFIKEKQITENDLILLNGLPRHTDQAENIDKKCCIIAILNR